MDAILAVGVGAGVLYLAICTGWLMIGGNWKWTDGIRRMAHTIWMLGLGIVAALAFVFLGPGVTLGMWPMWAVLIGGGLVFFGLSDLWHGVGWFKRTPKPEHNTLETALTRMEGKHLPYRLRHVVAARWNDGKPVVVNGRQAVVDDNGVLYLVEPR